MPYSERLTWDGVALHAGGIPGYPESHGCVHLPTRFAELLFGITSVGMTVVIANDASAPTDVAHAGFLSPVSARGAEDAEPRLASGDAWRWEPEKSAEGPVTVVVSAADRRILVLRNGVEIGRAAVTIASPETPLGNEAFLLKSVPGAPASPDSPAGTGWIGIALPGAGVGAGAPMDLKDAARVGVPAPFAAQLLKILGPGTTLYVTDAPVLAETTGPRLNVVNSDPPAGSRRSLEKGRPREPVRARVVRDDERPVLDRVDELAGDLRPHRRASPAPAEPALRGDDSRVHVTGAVQHDRALAGVVVEAGLESVQAQRRAVLAQVALAGAEDSQARHAAPVAVGEPLGGVLAAAAAVRHALGVAHAARRDVEDEEPRLGRGARVVDHGQDVGAADRSRANCVLPGRQAGRERGVRSLRHLRLE